MVKHCMEFCKSLPVTDFEINQQMSLEGAGLLKNFVNSRQLSPSEIV